MNVKLPQAKAPNPVAPSADAGDSLDPQPAVFRDCSDAAANRRQPLILVIDDDSEVLENTVRILEKAGYRVVTGGTAADAVRLTRQHRPDLALLDVVLPGGSGVDASRTLKQDPALADVFIILLSGFRISPEEQAEGLLKGLADGYITRPFSQADFLARIDAFLRIRAAQEALREERLRLSNIIKGTNVGTWEWNVQTGETIFNDRWAEIIGYSLDEISPVSIETWMKYTHPDDLKASGELLEKHFRGELDYYEFEARMKHKDGNLVWVLDRGKVISWSKDGKPLMMMGTHQDITARKQASIVLQESEERYRTLIQAAMDGFILADMQGRLLEVNDAYCRMSGYSARELLTMHIPDLEAAELAGDIAAHIQKILTQGEDRFESRHRRKDGRIFDIETSVQYRPIEGGRFVGFMHDITTRKQAEASLRTALSEKEVLLKEVHHRVKNNLAAILGLLDLQGQTIGDDSTRAAMKELSKRIRSMAMVHEQLYQSNDFSRIDFQDYLEELCVYLRSSYHLSGDISVSVSAVGVKMGLDIAVPCGLLVTELVTNAFKYAFPAGRQPEAGCKIDVSAQWDGVIYTLAVADNGVGLPAGMDWSHAKTLGLALVKLLGEHQLQGRIEVDRTSGTTFRLRFAPRLSFWDPERINT